MPNESADFLRDYRQRLPWPLAELYSRAFNRPAPRSRHDNAFYLCEALIKLAAAPAIACYLRELDRGGQRVENLDRQLAQLARPSLGQWLAMLRDLARHFGRRVDAGAHPLGHLWAQLNAPHAELPNTLALYRRIKNGADGQPAADTSCSLLELFNALVQYRNGVFGHGGPRFEAFFVGEMGPLLLAALNEVLAEGVFDVLGPPGTRLVYLAEQRTLDDGRVQIALRELVGADSERLSPLELDAPLAAELLPGRVAVLWPREAVPLRLDPLLRFRESELAEEVLFLNSDINGREVQYLSYTTGRTERDKTMAAGLAALLARVTNWPVDETELERLGEQSIGQRTADEPLTSSDADAGRMVGDYQLLAEIGRGGMGIVYLARQQSLGRLVALKMLPADLGQSEVSLARFKREMRHLARTNHPHIVKVLDSGTFADGRMYYTMEYVPGSDLEQVWRELAESPLKGPASSLGNSTWCRAVLGASRKQRARAEGSQAGSGPKDPSAPSFSSLPALPLPPLPELPNADDDPGGYVRRVVALVRDAALALESVHEQGIVHRDIKPANLMLTPDGSRIVLMDFGLAKGQTASSLSMQAGFLGTLRYAAPEQLAAAMIKVGPSADIRGLGVTLWELLTRRRLFGDADERQLPELVQQHDVPALRSIDPSFDRDLESIVARATERRTSDRIASAGKLAEYLQMYLDGQSLPIRPPGVSELLGRWVREHRPLVASAATAAAAIVLVTALAFLLINRSRTDAIIARNEAVDARQATEAANDQLADANIKLKKSRDEALSARHATEAANRRLSELNDKLESAVAQLEQANADLTLSRNEAATARDAAQKHRELALASLNRVIVEIEHKLENVPNAQAMRRSLLANAMEGLTKISSQMAGDAGADRSMLVAHLELGDVFAQIGNADGSSGLQKARQEYETARRIAKKLIGVKSHVDWAARQLSVTDNKLGDIDRQSGQLDAAREHYEQALASAEKQSQANPDDAEARRDISIACNKLGDLSRQQGHLDAARKHFERGLELARQLAEADPKDTAAQRDLSISYNKLGDISQQAGRLDEAREYFQRCLMIFERMARADRYNAAAQRDLAISYNKLGDLDLKAGKADTARKQFERCLAIFEKTAEADPNNAVAQRDLSVTFIKLGEICLRAGELDQAQKYYEQCREIFEKLAEADPGNAEAQRDLSVSYESLGGISRQAGKLEAAGEYYGQALVIRERLVQADPKNAQAQRDLSVLFDRLGNVSRQAGQLDAARRYSERGLAIAEKLVEADPSNAEVERDLFVSLFRLGTTDSAAHRYADAVESFERAVGVLDNMHEQGRHVVEGELQECKRTLDGAKLFASIVARKEVLRQLPAEFQPLGLAVRGWGLAATGKLTEAAAAAAQLRTLKPLDATNLYNAATTYSLCAKHVDPKHPDAATQRRLFVELSLSVLGEAIDAGYKNAEHLQTDYDLAGVRGLPRFATLVDRVKAASAASPGEQAGTLGSAAN